MREIRSTTDLVKSTFTGDDLDTFAAGDGPDGEEGRLVDAVNADVAGDRPQDLAAPDGSPVEAGLPTPGDPPLPPPAPTASAEPSLPPPPPAFDGPARPAPPRPPAA
jgi:hypothetical protein